MLNHSAQYQDCMLKPFNGNFGGMELHERILRAVELSGKKKGEVAAHCGVSPGALSQWISGSIQNLKFNSLFSLSDATGYSARWIALEEGPEKASDLPGLQITSQESALLSIYRDLSQHQQEMLFGIIRGMKSVSSDIQRPKSAGKKFAKKAAS